MCLHTTLECALLGILDYTVRVTHSNLVFPLSFSLNLSLAGFSSLCCLERRTSLRLVTQLRPHQPLIFMLLLSELIGTLCVLALHLSVHCQEGFDYAACITFRVVFLDRGHNDEKLVKLKSHEEIKGRLDYQAGNAQNQLRERGRDTSSLYTGPWLPSQLRGQQQGWKGKETRLPIDGRWINVNTIRRSVERSYCPLKGETSEIQIGISRSWLSLGEAIVTRLWKEK